MDVFKSSAPAADSVAHQRPRWQGMFLGELFRLSNPQDSLSAHINLDVGKGWKMRLEFGCHPPFQGFMQIFPAQRQL